MHKRCCVPRASSCWTAMRTLPGPGRACWTPPSSWRAGSTVHEETMTPSASRATLEFLKRLLDTPGPSGFETAPARVWRDEVKRFADEMNTDVHGNSIAAINPTGKPRLMLAGHIDEIGLQITH